MIISFYYHKQNTHKYKQTFTYFNRRDVSIHTYILKYTTRRSLYLLMNESYIHSNHYIVLHTCIPMHIFNSSEFT